ncbi:eukaryotic translation initiation factor 2 subunit alpha [Phakopsora pachyrhizi]|nr:eukaryotic translation initiation factor 2 subunit alpha [Phakopsora pachyrhizi]
MGSYVKFLEYDNIKGMILLSELSSNLGTIKCKEWYNKSKTNTDMEMETINEMIAWLLFEKYSHAFDAFKLSISKPDTVFGDLKFPENMMKHLTSNIAKRLTLQTVKVRAEIEARCFSYSGIDATWNALKLRESMSTESWVAPPLYLVVSNATDKQGAIKLLKMVIERIGESLKKDRGKLVVKMKPKAFSKTNNLNLSELMGRVARENKEISQDKGNDDDDQGREFVDLVHVDMEESPSKVIYRLPTMPYGHSFRKRYGYSTRV